MWRLLGSLLVTRLAQASDIATPTRAELAKLHQVTARDRVACGGLVECASTNFITWRRRRWPRSSRAYENTG